MNKICIEKMTKANVINSLSEIGNELKDILISMSSDVQQAEETVFIDQGIFIDGSSLQNVFDDQYKSFSELLTAFEMIWNHGNKKFKRTKAQNIKSLVFNTPENRELGRV